MSFLKSAIFGNQDKLPKISSAQAARIKNILGINQLDTLPASAARAFQVANNPRSTSGDFVDIIESDEALSARILRIANSVYFSRGNPVKNIEMAVANIGIDELRCLLSAGMLKSLLTSKSKARAQVWANSIATAIFSKGLSHLGPNIDSGEAFLCGLMHDVGKLLILRRAPDKYDKVIALVGNDNKNFITVEEEILELNHSEVGQWFAEHWKFPASITQAIALHHQPWPSDGSSIKTNHSLAFLIKAADCMAHSAAIGHDKGSRALSRYCQAQLPECIKYLSISTDEGEKFIQKLSREFDAHYSLYE
ncbi:MAG: HDOD domain-containing protein [Deltaproteobacteria bacterium]|nr:HDOD domain-containing protein [Deltaproteobacteria bacterium]